MTGHIMLLSPSRQGQSLADLANASACGRDFFDALDGLCIPHPTRDHTTLEAVFVIE